MKKLILLLFVCFLVIETYSQSEFRTKNRYDTIPVDTIITGLWLDNIGVDAADSTYIYYTSFPDYGDLRDFDLELKVKSLWFGTKVFFLLRHLDDSLVDGNINGEPDLSIAEDLENRDATALYFFLDSSDARLDNESPIYTNDFSYKDSIAWIRWVWGSDDFEGQIAKKDITSIEELGGEIIQWKEDRYLYTKLSIDIDSIAPNYIVNPDTIYRPNEKDTLIGPSIKRYSAFGFEIELDENDKEVLNDDDLWGIQTRAYWNPDIGSNALEPINVQKWGWLYFTYGDTCTTCGEQPSLLKLNTSNFASIYPNPTSNYINIQLDTYNEVEYKIYDLMGSLVQNGSFNGLESRITLSNLRMGTYYIQLMDKKGSLMTHKILILR